MSSTAANLFLHSGGAFETHDGRSTSEEIVEAARRRAGWLSRFPHGSGVLIEVANSIAALEVALGAWWVGHRVAFAVKPGGRSSTEQAEAVEAAVHVRSEAFPAILSSGVVSVDISAVDSAPVTGRPQCTPTDVALDVLTSGTTGRPKCVTFDHAATAANSIAVANALQLSSRDRLWTSLPLGLPGVLCTVVLPAAARSSTTILHPQDDVLAAGAALVRSAPSIVYAVPAVYEAMARAGARDADTSSVRWWLSSSAHLDPSLFDAMRARWGATLRSFYCGSEVGTVTFNDAPDVARARTTVGRPLPGVQLGFAGERIVVGGELVGLGYRRNGMIERFPRTGVVTGDVGQIDADGYLCLFGREDDRIHVGADIVDPLNVEARVTSQPGVRECIAISRPHPMHGSVVEVLVVLEEGAVVFPKDVIRRCREDGLSHAWVPRRVTFVDAVPKTLAGKPDRRAAARLGKNEE